MADKSNPWRVDADVTYGRRPYWAIYRHNPKFYGGAEYLLNAQRTDKKRFYSEDKANAEAKRLNGD